MQLIKAFQKNDELLKDIYSSNDNKKGFRFWWLGQSGFLLQYNGSQILFDPYLSDSLSLKYQNTEKPHTRMSELAIHSSKLKNIDIVFSSHNHTDHLDAETLIPLFDSNPFIEFVIPEANREFVTKRCEIPEEKPIGLVENQHIRIKEFEIIALPAAHNELTTNDLGHHLFLSYIVKFGQYCIYHSGDTLWYEGLESRLNKHNIDVAFLPINGNKPERKVAGNLSALEAAKLGKVINAKLVVPHHFHMFSFNTEDPISFEKECLKYKTPFKTLQIGEGFNF